MGWFAEIWERWFAMREVERPRNTRPRPQYPPGVERFLEAVVALDWRVHGFDYELEPEWIGTVEDPATRAVAHFRLDVADEYREFVRRVVAGISDEELCATLEFLRQPPWDWMRDFDKESWDSWAGELLFEFWKERPDELLPLISAELEYPGIRSTILNSFAAPEVAPYLLPWVDRLFELTDAEVVEVLDCFWGWPPKTFDRQQLDLMRTAVVKINAQVTLNTPEFRESLRGAEKWLAEAEPVD